MQEIYTVIQLAAYLKLSPFTVRKYIKAGLIQAFKVGNDYRITKENVGKFITEGSIKGED